MARAKTPARAYWAASKTGTYDPRRFDMEAFVGKATAHARSVWSDAVLVSFEASMVDGDGLVDLTADPERSLVAFGFRSRTAPEKGDATCAHWVFVDAHGAWSGYGDERVNRRICAHPLAASPPKRACRLAQVAGRLTELHGPASGRTLGIVWSGAEPSASSWKIDMHPTPSDAGTSWINRQLPDACAPARR